jgi:hypothetical protein
MEIELFGQLADNQEPIRQVEIVEPMTVRELAERLDLNTELVGLTSIDGKLCDWSAKIHNHQRVCFFPYLDGG